MLLAYLDTAIRQGMPAAQVIADMATGRAALRLADVARDTLLQAPPPVVTEAACARGCAFCCILAGGDGGTVTEVEARRLHAALEPLAGTPDGRGWHPSACPALDPDTRACRAYDARPTICRSFVSTDAEACRTNAEGGEAAGAGVLGSHIDYLAVQALVREVLQGIARVPTFALARVAAGAVEGEPVAASLGAARHPPRTLPDIFATLAGRTGGA
ncbi:YkgJ family cysteine cluster protein [Pseudooceanicola sp. LIPI14-2-Ac024]|uniref:YkgJ family cysteine cluster protein n=1 Tax=Pseudooceanicola sp. LIPI14-2-Ac024 TaxID=3344875 RepID=UPI0035D0C9BA